MDEAELAKAGVGGVLTYELIKKVLGPTADVVGKQLANWTGRGLKNIERIVLAAIEKRKNLLPPNEQVPLKVAKALILVGPFCDDTLGAEYFGGILASSRSSIDRDGRAVTFLSHLQRMSAY